MILYVILFPMCSEIPTHLPRSSLDLPGNVAQIRPQESIQVARNRSIAKG
jgi:hypothetical protein